MQSSEYESKLMDILALPQFQKITTSRKNAKNAVLKEHDRVAATLSQMQREGRISQDLHSKLKPIGSQPPRLYGLAKVHKQNTPLRPVLSMPASAYYNIAKQVAEWLAVIPQAQINTSSKQISDEIKQLNLGDDEEMISFDVSALYTNVPVKEAIQIAADCLYAGNHPEPPVDKQTFIELTTLASIDVVMSTHDGFYKQSDGLAMGSPPAPYLANVWLSVYDPVIKADSKMYQRYMDDIITTTKTTEVDNKLSEINQLHANLKFTTETETEGRLPFLDLCIVHSENELFTTWYSKPTDTGLIMNFHAVAPRRYKRAVVQGFIHRIFRACSTWEAFHESVKRAKQVLERNQYPPEFYDPIIHQTVEKILSKHHDNRPRVPEEGTQSFSMLVQYRGRVTDNLVRQLNKIQSPRIRTILTLRKLKTTLPSLKSPVPLQYRSRVVYQIECPGCQSSYVGCTIRHLSARIGEHRNARTPVGSHFKNCISDSIDWEDVKILHATPRSVDYLLALEALYIEEVHPELNTKEEYRSRNLTLRF